MEKADHKPADKFIDALIKSLQSLCHGYLDFQKGVEIIGYINLSVDKENSVDCVLKERVCKTAENATSFISNSFHAKPEEASAENGQSGNQAALSKKSREKSATSSDSDVSHSRHGNSKRKASEDQNNDIYPKKSSSHPSKVPRLSAESSHPSSSSLSIDSKADLQKMIASGADASETEHSQSSSRQSKSPVDTEQVKLTGIVLEPVDDQSYGGEDDGDFDVTFIKEEYFEDESPACEFQNPSGQQVPGDQYRTGQNPNSTYGIVSSQSSTSTASSFKVEPSEHLDLSGNSSFQPHPGPSGIREIPWSCRQAPTSQVQRNRQLLSSFHQQTVSHREPFLESNLLDCPVCCITFSSIQERNQHKCGSLMVKNGQHICNICGKGITRKEDFEDHLNKHRNIKAHACPYCTQPFTYKNNLRQHIRSGVCQKYMGMFIKNK